MDLRVERKDNKDLVVIRSSSCVIKICETSSTFRSCHSDTSTSVSQETRISREVKPLKRVYENEAFPRSSRKGCYSEEDAVVERSPASGSKQKSNSQEEDSMHDPRQLPQSVLKLIEPSVREAVHAHRSHHINDYDMLEILIQVLNELKLDCKSIFEKRKSLSSTEENAVKLIIRECFTEIMVRYSTDSPSCSKGNSYNRCQKIISRSVKNLTLECVDIIEKAICKQAKIMRNNRQERENSKSLLIKLMQIIQTELNTSKPVLKVVNTELHQPSFQFIFELLQYFIEKCALGFKSFCQKSIKSVSNRSRRFQEAGEVSDHRSEISISVADQKLEEYASRLDRLLKKVSSEQPCQEDPQLVIDCYHCTTKCKEQDLLLKTVTRFTEEIKQELINHARVVHEGSRYSYIGHSKGKPSRDVSLSSQDASPLQSHARGLPDFPYKRSSSTPRSCSPQRNIQPRPLPAAAESTSKSQADPFNQQSACCDTRQNFRSLSPAGNPFPAGSSHREYKTCAQNVQQNETLNNNVNACITCEQPNVNSRPTSPSCLHKHEVQGLKRSTVLKSKSVPQSQKCNACTSLHGGAGANKQELVNKCRYCVPHTPHHKPCAYHTAQLEDIGKKVIPHGPVEIFESGASYDKLPKPPMLEKKGLNAIPEYNRTPDHKIVPKEEQGLVKKSKPSNEGQAKTNDKPKRGDNLKQDEKLVKNDKHGDEDKAETQLKSEGKNGYSPDENASLKSVPSKTEKASNKSSEKPKKEKKVSLVSLPKGDTSGTLKTPELTNDKKIPELDEKQKKSDPPSSEIRKELKLLSENVEPKRADETLQQTGNVKTDQQKDPAHCCRMNCNCRNRRSETQAKQGDDPPRRDSMNQTDQEQHSQNNSCCKGCNCGQGAIPVFMNGCMCKTTGAQDGEIALRPIYQFFANPVPVPCNCKDGPPNTEQKELQASKPATPKSNRRVSQETGTQTSKNELSKVPSESEPLSSTPCSSAPSKSVPSNSAPSTNAASSGPTSYSSGSEPTYLKSSTSQPTSSTTPRAGKSDSMLSCTCSMDKRPSQSTETHTSRSNMKNACTSDTNCCCPEKIEEVFQEFDDKYSQVVKEIKFLIKEGHIPLNNEETRELTVTATRSSPKGTSSKTATCRCTQDSCKRCRGNPAAAFSRNPHSQPVHSQKGYSNNYDIDNECEEGFQGSNYKSPKKQMKQDNSECEEQTSPPQYASRDTFIYNELQRDIHDLKELVKNTRFGNCPCCKCCKCEPQSHRNPCTTNTDDTRNNTPPQEDNKNVSDSAAIANAGKDTEKQRNALGNQADKKSEPSVGQPKSNDQPNKSQPGSTNYFGTAPTDALKRMTVPRESEDTGATKSPSPSNEPTKTQDSIMADNKLEESGPPLAVGGDDNIGRKNENPLSESQQETARERGMSQDPDGKVIVTRKVDDDQLKGPNQAEEDRARNLPFPPNKQDSGDPSGAKTTSSSSSPHKGEDKAVPQGTSNGQPDTSTKRKSTDSKTGAGSPGVIGKGPNETNGSDAVEKTSSLTSPSQTASSSILKEPSKEKVERTTPKKVEIDEPPSKAQTGITERSDGFFYDGPSLTRENDFGGVRKPPQTGSEQLPQKTVSNVSFGSRKSARSTTSSKNLVLSPEQEALFQSRERLRDYSSQVFASPSDAGHGTGRDAIERQYGVAKEPGGPATTTVDDQSGVSGHNTKTATATKTAPASRTAPAKDNAPSSSDDSVDDSSGDSTVDICRTLLEDLNSMPCRFWSEDEATPPCRGVKTYVMVLETETSNDLATRDKTFIINKPTRATNKATNENIGSFRLKKAKELETPAKSNLIHQTAFLASKGTSTLWRGITSPIGIIRGLCKLSALVADPKTTELSTEILERELSKKLVRKPAKKLVSPLNVSSHYTHVKCRMPKSRDRKRRSGGDLRTYSSECFKRNSAKPRTSENKEVQVTKWNAMTQTAGPRKFNRTDISKEIEDKLARYLGLERTVEDVSLSLTFSSKSEDENVTKGSTVKSKRPHKRERNCETRTKLKK